MDKLKSYTVTQLCDLTKKNYDKKKVGLLHEWYSEIMKKVKTGQYDAVLHFGDDDCDSSDCEPYPYVEGAVEDIEKLFPGICVQRETGPGFHWFNVWWTDEEEKPDEVELSKVI